MKTLSADEVQKLMPAGAWGTLLDEIYACPAAAWVHGPLSAALNDALTGFRYVRDRFDCDDFARMAWTMANLGNDNCPKDCGLAFGMFFYVQDSGVPHAINFFIAEGVFFYEPQTQRIIELSRKEIESCSEYIC